MLYIAGNTIHCFHIPQISLNPPISQLNPTPKYYLNPPKYKQSTFPSNPYITKLSITRTHVMITSNPQTSTLTYI